MNILLGLSAFVPIVHGVVVNGWQAQNERQSISYFIGLAILNVAGGSFYAARIPERWYPRRFDIFGSSHQIMHILVICGAWTWSRGLEKAFDYWYSRANSTHGACGFRH